MSLWAEQSSLDVNIGKIIFLGNLSLCVSFSFSLLLPSRWKTRLRCRRLPAPPSAPSWTFSSAVLSSWPWPWPASCHSWAQPVWALQPAQPWPWLPWPVCWSWPLWCCPYGEEAAGRWTLCLFACICVWESHPLCQNQTDTFVEHLKLETKRLDSVFSTD